jgi:hypothetical protein
VPPHPFVLVPRQRRRQPDCRRGGSDSLLAHVLLERTRGKRPAILSGFGLGARVIFDCLLALAEALKGGDMRAAGVIQHVVLTGLPATADPEVWKGLRLVVAGRVVNCYRPNDLVLLIVHRAANMTYGVAGLGEVSCDSVENYDVSGIVHAHGKCPPSDRCGVRPRWARAVRSCLRASSAMMGHERAD